MKLEDGSWFRLTFGEVLNLIVVLAAMLWFTAQIELRLRSIEATVLLHDQMLRSLTVSTEQLKTLAEIYVPKVEELSKRQEKR